MVLYVEAASNISADSSGLLKPKPKKQFAMFPNRCKCFRKIKKVAKYYLKTSHLTPIHQRVLLPHWRAHQVSLRMWNSGQNIFLEACLSICELCACLTELAYIKICLGMLLLWSSWELRTESAKDHWHLHQSQWKSPEQLYAGLCCWSCDFHGYEVRRFIFGGMHKLLRFPLHSDGSAVLL